MKRILSFGAGVQSTALFLMGIHGEFGDRPDAAIFADVGFEPPHVYAHLAWMEQFCASIGFPLLRVSAGNLRDDTIAGGKWGGFRTMPFFVTSEETRGSAMLRRQCTKEYKLQPLRRAVRSLTNGEPCEQWIGISLDEYHRMKQSDVKYITNRYPLVDSRIDRNDCMLWLERNGYPVPGKSACIGCPFHSDHVWREMKLTDPESWAQAVEFDASIRVLPRIQGLAYLHSDRKPLAEVELGESQIDLFGQECEGLCGV